VNDWPDVGRTTVKLSNACWPNAKTRSVLVRWISISDVANECPFTAEKIDLDDSGFDDQIDGESGGLNFVRITTDSCIAEAHCGEVNGQRGRR